jgi:4'-phosphopantetheinyl transferase
MNPKDIINQGKILIKSINFSKLDEKVNFYEQMLSAEEKKTAQRKITEHLRKKYILSRGVLKENIAMLTEQAPIDVVVKEGVWGKPLVKTKNKLEFNVAQSDDKLVMAFALNNVVGIDVEKIKAPVNPNVAKNFMSQSEYDTFMNLNEIERTAYFYKIWTLKESLVKAYGSGLQKSLSVFTLKQDDKTQVFSIEENSGEMHDLTSYKGIHVGNDSEYYISIASDRADISYEFCE